MANLDEYKVDGTDDWDVFVHRDQTCPGRVYFWRLDDDEYDLFEVPKCAFLDLRAIGKKVESVIIELFGADMFNHSSLNNRTRKLLVHMIPRFEKPVEKYGKTFVDQAFGKRYVANPRFVDRPEIMLAVAKDLKSKLSAIPFYPY